MLERRTVKRTLYSEGYRGELATDWKQEANCYTITTPYVEMTAAMCDACPVTTQCADLLTEVENDIADLGEGLQLTKVGGVWGGEDYSTPRTYNPSDFPGVPRWRRRADMPKECTECGDKVQAKGLCIKHYFRARRLAAA